MKDDDQRKAEIVQLFEESAKPKRTRRTTAKSSVTVHVQGDGNTVAGRDVITSPRVVVRTTFTPGPEHITPSQARKLQELVKEIVTVEQGVKRSPRPFAAVWGAFNKRFQLNRYDALPHTRFDEAVKYFQQALGRLRSAKSAPKKLSDQRPARSRAIHTRERKLGIEHWRKQYILDRFGKTSLKDLSDQELEQTYRAVMGKKPSTSA